MGKNRTFPYPKRDDKHMNLWPELLILATVGLFLLPLLPTFIELVYPTDVSPLRVVQEYDNDPFHFAAGFKHYLTIATPEQLGVANVTSSRKPITLHDDTVYESEIYSKEHIETGKNSRFRALFSGNTLTINENGIVLRWAHSDGEMRVKSGSTLLGRATSNQMIVLAEGCYFERLHAPKIVIGEEKPHMDNAPLALTTLEVLKDVKVQAGRRSLLEGNLDFPAYHTFDGDIVAGSTAIVGDYAHIKGSIKSNAMNDIAYYLQTTGVLSNTPKNIARCELGHYVRIDGSVISTHDLYIGENCRIAGPVIAENLIVIRSGTIIGTLEQPCTISAPQIIIESGCVIYGTIWAGKQGFVTAVGKSETELAA